MAMNNEAIFAEVRARIAELKADKARLDALQEAGVDTVYMDDGRIIDVRSNDLRERIDKWIAALTAEVKP